MALLGTLFNVGIARRVGLWALIQALPDEDALHTYLRAAYMGLAGVIIGSVLTGSAIAAGIVAIYHLLISAGWEQSLALATTAGFTLLLILACFTLAARWFIRLANIKNDVSLFKESPAKSLSGIVTHAVQNVAEGFVEGLSSQPAQPKKLPPRRVRLIS